MKTLNKIFAGMLIASVAFGFFGCSDEPEEDENLVVSFSETGTSEKTITMSAPSEYDGETVYIAYTIDGSTPEVGFNSSEYQKLVTAEKTAEEIKAAYGSYLDFGTADLYDADNKPTFNSTTTITARAFYIKKTTGKVTQGATAQTYTVTISTSSTGASTTVKDTVPTSEVTFNLASTANSISTKYFDTSSTDVFKYGDKTAYYQTQFSWKGTGKGNWYLYMREVGGGMIKNGSNTFIAKGTYTGSAFDTKSVSEITAGDVKLKNNNGSTENTITITNNKSFTLKVNGVDTSGSYSDVYVGDAK